MKHSTRKAPLYCHCKHLRMYKVLREAFPNFQKAGTNTPGVPKNSAELREDTVRPASQSGICTRSSNAESNMFARTCNATLAAVLFFSPPGNLE